MFCYNTFGVYWILNIRLWLSKSSGCAAHSHTRSNFVLLRKRHLPRQNSFLICFTILHVALKAHSWLNIQEQWQGSLWIVERRRGLNRTRRYYYWSSIPAFIAWSTYTKPGSYQMRCMVFASRSCNTSPMPIMYFAVRHRLNSVKCNGADCRQVTRFYSNVCLWKSGKDLNWASGMARISN